MHSANKGEWSELYAFIKLLKEGRIYAADENVERLENVYFPIIKLIREEQAGIPTDYFTGAKIEIYENGQLIDTIENDELVEPIDTLYQKILEGGTKGAFEIHEAEEIMESLHLTKVKAASSEKKDITMQIHDIHTAFEPVVGFSVKSELGNPPTLLNAGKNTRFVYEIEGINDEDLEQINAIDKTVVRDYMVDRMKQLFQRASKVQYIGMKDDVYRNNLEMIDSRMPELYGNMILNHYKYIENKIYECAALCKLLKHTNPLGFGREDFYSYKFKKLLCATALGMTPGKEWDGKDNASGGYIIIKRDGDVVCYHIYNRNFFEEYLYRNTQFDRPSATRHDFGYVYKENDRYFIDLNVQIRFKSTPAGSNWSEGSIDDRFMAYVQNI